MYIYIKIIENSFEAECLILTAVKRVNQTISSFFCLKGVDDICFDLSKFVKTI